MKTPAWLELPAFAAILLAGMLLVMWAQRPAAGCGWRAEPDRQLVLSRQVDREHLAADLAMVDRSAARYAQGSDAVEQQTRFLECQATLAQRLATTHGLSPEQIRSSPADAQ